MIDTSNTPSVLFAGAPLARSCYQVATLSSTRAVTPVPALGNSFQPSEYDVVCGRGKGFYNRPGNKRFRELVYQHMAEYQNTRSKIDKSMVLNRIIDQVRQQNHGNARFIKNDKKRGGWFEIGDDQAREKVGHIMREAIAAKKESSEQRKTATTQISSKNSELIMKHQNNLLAQQQQLFARLLAMSENAGVSADAATVVSV